MMIFYGYCIRISDTEIILLAQHQSDNRQTASADCATDVDAVISVDPRPTQPSIPPGSVKEYQLQLARQRQVWFILLADERGVYR